MSLLDSWKRYLRYAVCRGDSAWKVCLQTCYILHDFTAAHHESPADYDARRKCACGDKGERIFSRKTGSNHSFKIHRHCACLLQDTHNSWLQAACSQQSIQYMQVFPMHLHWKQQTNIKYMLIFQTMYVLRSKKVLDWSFIDIENFILCNTTVFS